MRIESRLLARIVAAGLLVAVSPAEDDGQRNMRTVITDELVMTSGDLIHGDLVSEDAERVQLRLPSGVVGFERARVVKINHRVTVRIYVAPTWAPEPVAPVAPVTHREPPPDEFAELRRGPLDREALGELSLGLQIGKWRGTDSIDMTITTVSTGVVASGTIKQKASDTAEGGDLELVRVGHREGLIWGAAIAMDGSSSVKQVDGEIRLGWRYGLGEGWRADLVAGGGLGWMQLHRQARLADAAGTIQTATVDAAGLGPVARLEARIGPRPSPGWSWAVVGGASWTMVSASVDYVTNGGVYSVSETHHMRAMLPYAGLRLGLIW